MAREVALDQAEDLRNHQRGAGTLDGANDDQRLAGRRDPTREGRRREQRQSPQEGGSEAEAHAESRSGDQQDRVGDDVARDDELEVRTGRAEIQADRGDRDVHDGRVEDGHELAGEDQGEEDLHAARQARIGLSEGGRRRHVGSHALVGLGAATSPT